MPETAVELLSIARSLGAEPDSVFVRERATEHRVRTTDLSNFKVVAFATHALVAGEFKGIAEPGLVMSPPDAGTVEDDGFLTASEIATLDLDADLVLLSACNTAAADGTPGAEGLSGLAKAFFYAGSRALVVSHWSVESDAAAKLTTGMLAHLAENSSDGRAEALRQSMLDLMQDDDAKPYHAHPMFWAGFSLVGEGKFSVVAK